MAIHFLGSLQFLAFAMALLFLDNSANVSADCSITAIGLENMYIIPNSSFTASSFFDKRYSTYNARLHGYNGWGPGIPKRENEYLQVDLGYPYVICAIATQGGKINNEWAKKYRIMTSVYGTKFADYKENSEVKVFTGNTDRNTIVKNKVYKLLARYIRIYPTEYQYWPTMRVELFGYPEACDNLPLGMESGNLQDITASSGQSTVKYAGLHHKSDQSWCASTSDSDPYLQVDLGSSHLFCAVAIQGNNLTNQWVTTYQLNTSTDGTTWTTYQENNTYRVFQGNFDRSTVMRQVLFHGTIARYIRIMPRSYRTAPCLRTEIYGYRVNRTCSSHSLGMPSSKLIPNHRFTATSSYNKDHQPYMARLGSNMTWGPTLKDVYDYLQIDLGAVSYICSIETQGNGITKMDLYEWVTAYKVLYSTTSNQWITYKENGTDKEFSGNKDQSTIVTNSVKDLFQAKFIRVLPTEFNRWKSMRVDFKGLPGACVSSLGLENSHLPDSKITSSSDSDSFHTAVRGRLYSSSSWCSASSASNQYIQVDLGETKTVTGIGTQGDKDLNKWVTSYKVSYSFDGTNWYDFKEDQLAHAKVFDGNKNNKDVIVNWLRPPIAALYIRIFPKTNSGGPCLRFDLYGCTYYIPESPSNSVTADKKFALLQWKDINTHEGKADNLKIVVRSERTGLSETTTLPNSPTTSTTIINLKPYMKYEVKVIGVKTKGRPLWQTTSTFETLMAEPEESPIIEGLRVQSSQSIIVAIKYMQTDKLNGPLAGYRIFYKPEGGPEKHVDVGIVTMAPLTNLEKYTVYEISVSVRNTKYIGLSRSASKKGRTLEDVPEIGPQNTQASKMNGTTYLITWSPLTGKQSNGIITKYEIIWYRETITSQTKPSCGEFLTAFTQGTQFNISSLKPNEKYIVLVRGYTSVGPGPNSTVSFLTSTSGTKSSTSSLCTTEGNVITLGCLTSNEQAGAVRYTWTRNGAKFEEDDAVKTEGNKLIVRAVKDEDFGTYVCNATNSEGTVTFTTSRYEVIKCSDEGDQSKKEPSSLIIAVIYVAVPLLVIVIAMAICIVYLVRRLRKYRKLAVRPDGATDDVHDNPALDDYVIQQSSIDVRDESPETPKQAAREENQRGQHYAEISAKQGGNAMYESVEDAARAVEEHNQKGKGNYMELKHMGPSTYEPLHRGDKGQASQPGQTGQTGQIPEQQYEKIPGYENVAMDISNA